MINKINLIYINLYKFNIKVIDLLIMENFIYYKLK